MNVRTLCLGILWFGDATGYEIKKLASEGRFSHFIEASFGSIYPSLNRLTEEGLVARREIAEPGKPTRKIYAITEKGRSALMEALGEGPKQDVFKSEFLFLCLYADHVDRATVSGAIDNQIAQISTGHERLLEAHAKCEHSHSQFAIGYGIALHDAALTYLEGNRHMIEQCADAPRLSAAE